MDWLTENKIPLGKWIKNFVDLLLEHLAWLFDSFSEAVEFLIEGLILAMLWPHPLVLVAIFAGLGGLGVVAHWCMVRAFEASPASLLAPFNYAKILWATILGFARSAISREISPASAKAATSVMTLLERKSETSFSAETRRDL